MSYKVLARKYRPARFDQLVGQEVVGRTLANAIARDRVHHAYLFCGPRGVGKTSAARILAMALNCEAGPRPDPCGQCEPCRAVAGGNSLDVQEIDGASHNGVDHVRQLQETAYTRPNLRCRIFIIDEVHMLTNQAFNALLKLLEEPPPSVHFIFATTEPHKVLDTIKSRCQRHDFKRIPTRRIVEQLLSVCELDGLQVQRDALRVVAGAADGGMRDALSLLEQVNAYTDGVVDGAVAAECLGLVDRRAVLALLGALRQDDRAAALNQLDELYSGGADMRRFADAIVTETRALLVAMEVERPESLIDQDGEQVAELRALARGLEPVHLRRWLRIALDAAGEISRSGHPRMVLELAILHMADAATAVGLQELLDWLAGGRVPPQRSAGAQALGLRPNAPPPGGGRGPFGRTDPAPPRPSQANLNRSAPPHAAPASPPPAQASLGPARPSAPPGPAAPPPGPGAGPQTMPPGPRPAASPMDFLNAVGGRSDALARTLVLAGLRIEGRELLGRLDGPLTSIIGQERSRDDLAQALAEVGLERLRLGKIVVESGGGRPSALPQPAPTAPPQQAAPPRPPMAPQPRPPMEPPPHATMAPGPPPGPPMEPPPRPPMAPGPPPGPPMVSQPRPPMEPPPRPAPPQSPPTPPAALAPLPPLDAGQRELLALWSSLFSKLPKAVRGRLVPFAPIARRDDTIVLGCDSPALLDGVSEALGAVNLDESGLRRVEACVPEEAEMPMLRALLRAQRAERNPTYREQLAMHQHETTQAVIELFGATVDEVGL